MGKRGKNYFLGKGVNPKSGGNPDHQHHDPPSDSALHSKVAPSTLLSLSPHLRPSPSNPALSEVNHHRHQLSTEYRVESRECDLLAQMEESASDTGSCSDLSLAKKKKSFFNFRKKKDKVRIVVRAVIAMVTVMLVITMVSDGDVSDYNDE